MSTATRPYRPIDDYAIIGDGRTAALVARNGSIDWYCLPHFDSPAVFCRILDTVKGGFFRVGPLDRFGVSRAYVDSTNILATTFVTAGGTARLTDFMPVQTPEASQSPQCIVRCLKGLVGRVDLALELLPTFDYGRMDTTVCLRSNGAVAITPREFLWLSCPVPVHQTSTRALTAPLTIRAGEQCWVVLAYGSGAPREPSAQADELEQALARTRAHWQTWSETCTYQGFYHELVRRSALTLKLLTFEPTGAIVAAPTTSLPEAIGGERNWDYRYTWLRDAAWMLDGLMSIGYHGGAMAFWRWLEALPLEHAGELRIMYRADGSLAPPEAILPHLSGYRDSRPVRIGNDAAMQTQLDIYGELINAIAICSQWMPDMRPLRPSLWQIITSLANEAAARWAEPDQGLWEMRGPPRHFLASKLMCWVAVDRALFLAARDRLPAPTASWQQAWTDIRRAILNAGYDRDLGAFTQAFDTRALDASTLLIPLVGFLAASDPRMRSTVAHIEERLTEQGLVFRYQGDDGLQGRDATFTLCTFWLIENLVLAGRIDDAWRLFERVTSYANDVGLLSEEIDRSTGELLGNYPQGFTHLALIRSAVHLAAAQL